MTTRSLTIAVGAFATIAALTCGPATAGPQPDSVAGSFSPETGSSGAADPDGTTPSSGSAAPARTLICSLITLSADSTSPCADSGDHLSAEAVDLPLGSAQDGLVIVNQLLASFLMANSGTSAGSSALAAPLSGSACAAGFGSGGLGPSRPDPCPIG